MLFGTVTAWQTSSRWDAADTVVTSSQPLVADAARIYRSLADANTTASAGFLAGAEEDPGVRERYENDIDRAARLLAEAAAYGGSTDRSQYLIELLNTELATYTGLVETARANNRQGLPLGGAYLRYADDLMQDLLPRAEELYDIEREHLQQDIDAARSWPWLAVVAGLLCLAVLAWAQRRTYLRTNRVFNAGLLTATATATVLLLWLTGAQMLARADLGEADSSAASLSALTEAWTEALKARGDEAMNLVARGGTTEFQDSYETHMDYLAGSGQGEGLLAQALTLSGDETGRSRVEEAIQATSQWRERHAESRELETSGDYDSAVAKVIGSHDSTGESFDRVDESLDQAVQHEQREFDDAAHGGRGALTGLTVGALVLVLLGAFCVVRGIGSRLSEYR